MGAIEDVYEDLEADVPFEEFEAAVAEKVEQMGGLADEETAAMLVAHELDDAGGEVSGVADIEAGMDDVKFVAKVASIGERRTFERDGDQEDGRVVNLEVADETGRVRVSFWDEMADSAVEELAVGDVLRIAGRPKEGFNGVEVSADKAEIDEDADIEVQLTETYRVEDLSLGASDVDLLGRVLDVDERPRTFDRDDGSEGRVANVTLGDETGRVRVTLWDEQTDLLDELAAGDTVELVDGYVRERDGDLELHVGSRGAIEHVDEEVEYVPETADIADVEIGETVDLAGGVIETDEKRTFERDDGSQGQVRNIRVRDETGDIRVALWGEKADRDVDLADRVVLTDVEIQDGWQDELEASAGWRSTVTVMEGKAGDAGAADASASRGENAAAATATAGGDASGGQGGLSSFADAGGGGEAGAESADGAGDGTGSGGGSSRAGSGGGSGGAVSGGGSGDGDGEDVGAEGESVEFTGTVVQAGNPVVLDDGEQTRSVDTSEQLRLGEEVTVRGPLRDGRIDADEVF